MIRILSTLLILTSLSASSQKLVKFQSEDGIEVTADLYMTHPESAPFIVLFHQANWSRGEYNEIAPRLNELGYNCMAVDLRSGGAVNEVSNLTKLNASKALKSTQYVDALPDMRAAVKYARSTLSTGKLIIWGSSYSAALSLRLAADIKGVDAVVSFSPAEYFASQGMPRDYISVEASKLNMPVFVSSAKSEKNSWWGIYVSIPTDKKQYFLPETAGNHGSKALWAKYSDSREYWKAVEAFLAGI